MTDCSAKGTISKMYLSGSREETGLLCLVCLCCLCILTMCRTAVGSRKLRGLRVHCSHCFLQHIPLGKNNARLLEDLVTDLQKKNYQKHTRETSSQPFKRKKQRFFLCFVSLDTEGSAHSVMCTRRDLVFQYISMFKLRRWA